MHLIFHTGDFVTSNQLDDTFLYYNNISDPDSNGWPYLVDAPTNPGSGRIFWTEGSGSLNNSNQLDWDAISNKNTGGPGGAAITVTQPNSGNINSRFKNG